MEQETRSARGRPGGKSVRRLAALSPLLGAAGVVTHGLTAAVGLVIGIACLRLMRAHGACDRELEAAIMGVIVSAAVLAMGLLYPPLFASWREKARQGVCRTNVGQVARALNLYRTDHGDCYPLSGSWCDALAAGYLDSQTRLGCPNAPSLRSAYALNANLADQRHRPARRGDTVLLFEASGGWNASGGPELFAPRHSSGGWVAGTDARREWSRGSLVARRRWVP